VYAVGDIHGRDDLLNLVCAKIDANIQYESSHPIVQVFLGDYIDRGPASARVLTILAARRAAGGIICLRGNHEGFLLDFLDNPDALVSWRRLGGLQTLMSYGLTPSANPDALERRDLSVALASILPAQHRAFLESLPTSFMCGDYFFTHAGIRPGTRLDQQTDNDLMTIRNEFLLSEEDFGKIVVHGHTPVLEPEVHSNRINIDTGAYASGRLTCIKLTGGGYEFL
jgi:serine/threonine protein phosphatase 1